MGFRKVIPAAVTVAKSVKAYRTKQLRRAKAQKRAAIRQRKNAGLKGE